jgi:hypothetical protein
MTNKRSVVAVAAAVLMLSRIGAAAAEGSPPEATLARARRHHSINLGVGTLAGATSLSVEYRWTRGRGLVFDFHHLYLPTAPDGTVDAGGLAGLVPKASDATSWDILEATSGIGAAIGYRWYWGRWQSSGFHGVHVGGEVGHSGGRRYDIEHGTFYVVGNVGWRWLLRSNFQITARFGAGYALRSALHDIQHSYTWSVRPMDELVAPLPLTLDGELSVGYTF